MSTAHRSNKYPFCLTLQAERVSHPEATAAVAAAHEQVPIVPQINPAFGTAVAAPVAEPSHPLPPPPLLPPVDSSSLEHVVHPAEPSLPAVVESSANSVVEQEPSLVAEEARVEFNAEPVAPEPAVEPMHVDEPAPVVDEHAFVAPLPPVATEQPAPEQPPPPNPEPAHTEGDSGEMPGLIAQSVVNAEAPVPEEPQNPVVEQTDPPAPLAEQPQEETPVPAVPETPPEEPALPEPEAQAAVASDAASEATVANDST